jgi:hypothetical protein
MSRKRVRDAMKRMMLDPEVLAFFKKAGQSGGRVGGKIAASHMTQEQRTERAKKAASARWAKKRRGGK